MLRRIAVAAAICALYCASMFSTNGCGGAGTIPVSHVRTVLRGVITDAETSKPLEGVRVAFQGKVEITNSYGEYQFYGLRPGRSVVIATRDGYLVHELPVELREAEDNRFDFPMRRR